MRLKTIKGLGRWHVGFNASSKCVCRRMRYMGSALGEEKSAACLNSQ
jgi:hypothetical protein